MTLPDITSLSDRADLAEFMNQHGLVGTMVEVGAAAGHFAGYFLERWKGKVYYLVDPWEAQADCIYKEKQEGVDWKGHYEACCDLARRDHRVTLIPGMSVNAAPAFSDGELDCVFIDANHAYEQVMADLRMWEPKVHSGGIVAGHDFYNDTNWPHFCEVKKAVEAWATIMRVSIHHTPKCSSWFWMKP